MAGAVVGKSESKMKHTKVRVSVENVNEAKRIQKQLQKKKKKKTLYLSIGHNDIDNAFLNKIHFCTDCALFDNNIARLKYFIF